MIEKLTTYDPAEDLTTDEAVATFMAEAFHTNDVAYIAHALGVVARARGMAQIAPIPNPNWLRPGTRAPGSSSSVMRCWPRTPLRSFRAS